MKTSTVLPEERSEPRKALVKHDEDVGKRRTVVARDRGKEEGGRMGHEVHFSPDM